jgi:septum formation protein
LASASPRRLDLLAQIGVTPDRIEASDIDETIKARELPKQLCARLAEEKGQAVLNRLETSEGDKRFVVLAADTVVACGRRALPKAETELDARGCLELLSGRSHMVFTGVALFDGAQSWRRIAATRVQFGRLGVETIEQYLTTGEWRGKAGGYAIQGKAASFIRGVNGSYSNVVGLPLFETANLLRTAGYGL